MADNAMIWGGETTSDDRLWGLLAHLSCFIVPWVGSLLMYLIFKDKPFIRYHAMQSLLAQAGMWALAVVGGIIISIIATVTCGIGAILYVALLPLPLLPLWGAYKAYSGEWSGYPMISTAGQ